MKLVMTLLLRDNADILVHNLRYHLAQGVDFFIATDNLSTDATPEILREFERAGLLHTIHEPADTYDQGVWVTRMARLAATEFEADWIIHNDADEFWWPLRGTLKESFERIPADKNLTTAARSNFVYRSEVDRAGMPFYEVMLYREKQAVNALGRPLSPKVAHRANPDVVMPPGNHSVENIGPLAPEAGVAEVFHYPLRSARQYRNKIMTGGAALTRHPTAHDGFFQTWKHLHADFAQDEGFNAFMRRHSYSRWRVWRERIMGTIVRDTRLRDYMRAFIARPAC